MGCAIGRGRFHVCLGSHLEAVMANTEPDFDCVTLLVFKQSELFMYVCMYVCILAPPAAQWHMDVPWQGIESKP